MNYIDEGNPSDWNGTNPLCKECGEKEIEMNDEYCEDCFPCFECGERTDCDCIEEMDSVSYCCGANIDKDRGHCYQCKDNSETSLDSYCEEYKVEVVNDKLKKVK
tara:strand:- start:6028 stop:6342 length:315 start_codon:yes stop_codon:yes gene_type:complete